MLTRFLTGKITRVKLEQFVASFANDDKAVLDLGSRPGLYQQLFANVVGLDMQAGSGVHVIGDAHQLPFSSERFDMILCTEALEHFHSPWIAIDEMKRVLTRGGTLILTTRFIFPIHDAPHDYYRYTKYGLRQLFRNWEISSLEAEVSTKDTMAVLRQRLAFQVRFLGGHLTAAYHFLTARMINWLPDLTRQEYGDMARTFPEEGILASGYYMVCRKR